MKRSAGAAAVSSSPGRADNLPGPPGLAAMLRGKSGSRRTSVARSSPMFASRSRSVGASSESRAATAEGEPSSPKVTCIGQVRIRSKKRASTATAGSKKPNAEYQKRTWPAMRCRCLERALLCRIFGRKPAAGGPHRSLWRRWSLGLRSCGQRLKGLEREEPDLTYPPPAAVSWIPVSDLDGDEEDAAAAEEEEEEEKETRVFMPSATATPPKNALLLMRCRSAPHNRSSSLALPRFAVLPPAETGSSAGEEDPVPERGNRRGSFNGGASGTGAGNPSARPVVLTRCKSEPARTATEKLLAPEETAGFWNNGSGSRRRQLAVVREENGHPLPILTR